jgi:hypothetical protein
MKVLMYFWDDKSLGKNIGDWLSLLLVREISHDNVAVIDATLHRCSWFDALRVFFYRIRKRMFGYKNVRPISFYQLCLRLVQFRKKQLLLAIGSIMEKGNRNCIYWGTGFMYPSSIFPGGIVKAVR